MSGKPALCKRAAAFVYYFRLVKGGVAYYKIGCTADGWSTRFNDLRRGTQAADVVAVIGFASARQAYATEQALLDLADSVRPPVNKIASRVQQQWQGKSELYESDVLGLDCAGDLSSAFGAVCVKALARIAERVRGAL